MRRKKVKMPNISCKWDSCGIEFKNTKELNEHIGKHLTEINETLDDDDDGVICPWIDCDFHTNDIQLLKRHIYYHGYYAGLLIYGKYVCDTNASMPKCTALSRVGDKVPELLNDFHCEWADCQRKFISIINFYEHIQMHIDFDFEINKTPDEVRGGKLICNWNFCKKKLDNKYRLVEHVHSHSNYKQLACNGCGDLFRTKTTLFDHLRRQPDNNTHKFQCAQCYKYFATEKLLRAHVMKHINCYKCSICDMTCSSTSSLAEHVRYRHLKEKPFKCTNCDKCFVRNFDLNKHIHFVHKNTVHHCEEPGCNYAVRTYNRLRRHILEVHNNNPLIYVCHCCDKPFKNGTSLSAHLMKKHDLQLPSGHKRFRYRINADGFYRLETMRIESLEVTQQILTPNPFEEIEPVRVQDNSSKTFEIVVKTNEKQEERLLVSNNAKQDNNCIGEVVVSLPTMKELTMDLY